MYISVLVQSGTINNIYNSGIYLVVFTMVIAVTVNWSYPVKNKFDYVDPKL